MIGEIVAQYQVTAVVLHAPTLGVGVESYHIVNYLEKI